MPVTRQTTTETVQDSPEPTAPTRTLGQYAVLGQTIYTILGVIETVLLIRFVFRLLGANPNTGIVDLIYGLSNLLMQPFWLIFPTQRAAGVILEWSVLAAMVFYALFAWLIIKILEIAFTADVTQ